MSIRLAATLYMSSMTRSLISSVMNPTQLEVTGSTESSCKDDRIDQFGTTHIADKILSSVLLGIEDWPREDLVEARRWVFVNCGIGWRFSGDLWIAGVDWIETLKLWLGKEPCTMH